MKKIAFVPIDNRPVCCTLPVQIAGVNRDLELILPDRSLLGDLTKTADIDSILNWLESVSNVDAIVLSLDTIAYGGLVSSRRGTESFEQIVERIEKLKQILLKKRCKIFAFSSIMRISNNNINEEEKEYWSDFGTKIFEYSFNSHKLEMTMDSELDNKCNCIVTKIPSEILDDYLATRKRNFDINNLYISWAQEGIFDTLVFSKDDCAQYGLNVKEANELKKSAESVSANVLVKTGADEIPLSLLARAVMQGESVKIAPVFTQKDSVDKISKYEDVSVFESVKSQIELAGATFSNEDDADLILYVNNFKNQQGELVMDVFEEGFGGDLTFCDKPYFVADILNANGADNNFVQKLLDKGLDFDKFYGYAAWNTTGNTLGSVICAALSKFVAKNRDENNFKSLQAVRFLDDWAYQANVRKAAKAESKEPDISIVKEKMVSYEKVLSKKLEMDLAPVKYAFPWQRYFEIEVLLN